MLSSIEFDEAKNYYLAASKMVEGMSLSYGRKYTELNEVELKKFSSTNVMIYDVLLSTFMLSIIESDGDITINELAYLKDFTKYSSIYKLDDMETLVSHIKDNDLREYVDFLIENKFGADAYEYFSKAIRDNNALYQALVQLGGLIVACVAESDGKYTPEEHMAIVANLSSYL